MQTFLDAYIETALWSSTDDEGIPLDENYSASDIDPDALRRMAEDCAAFLRAYGDQIEVAGMVWSKYDQASAGHDFWLSRNGHGAGFWDRGLGLVGERLHSAAKTFGGCDLHIDDEGKIHT